MFSYGNNRKRIKAFTPPASPAGELGELTLEGSAWPGPWGPGRPELSLLCGPEDWSLHRMNSEGRGGAGARAADAHRKQKGHLTSGRKRGL